MTALFCSVVRYIIRISKVTFTASVPRKNELRERQNVSENTIEHAALTLQKFNTVVGRHYITFWFISSPRDPFCVLVLVYYEGCGVTGGGGFLQLHKTDWCNNGDCSVLQMLHL